MVLDTVLRGRTKYVGSGGSSATSQDARTGGIEANSQDAQTWEDLQTGEDERRGV